MLSLTASTYQLPAGAARDTEYGALLLVLPPIAIEGTLGATVSLLLLLLLLPLVKQSFVRRV